MKNILHLIVLYILLVPAAEAQKKKAKQPAKNLPNIIFILVDDMGYADLSSYGNRHLQTPNMDRIGREGITFSNFYVGSPICSPSRVAFMTGQYPARHRITSYLAQSDYNQKRGMADFLDPAAPAIARVMQEAGYATAHFGKWHMGGGRDVGNAPRPQAYGFDESLVSFEGLGDRLLIKGDKLSEISAELGNGKLTWVEKHEQSPIYVDRTLDFIKRNKEKEKPFYIHLWFNDVHDPFKAKEELLSLFTHYANNHYQQKFLATLFQLDQQVGRLLGGLDALGVAKNTIIVFSSDNGPTDWKFYYDQFYAPPGSADPFRGRKWSLYEGGIREPFMVRWPEQITAGQVDDKTVLHATDYFPTILKLAGVKLPKNIAPDGEDMSKALKGEGQERSKPLFWHYGSEHDIKPGNPRFVSPRLAMREGSWKLLINEDGTGLELFNLQQDHAEITNVADKNAALANRMSEQVLKWRRSLPNGKL